MASGGASLAGAEFTFRYYDGQYATSAEAEASGAPTRTWVFKTNDKGRIRLMDESLKVSGDDLFYNSMGQITLPIGTLLIQETKAPEGYLIDPTVYVRNITPDGTLEAVNSYNAPTVSEQVVTGRIQIVKHTDTGTTKVETPEVGATFNIYLASAGSYDAAPANAKAQLTIDKDGFAVSPDLPYGLYTVEQTSGWEGSRLMEPFTVKIDENGKTYSYIINNERFYSYLKVVKVDAITGEAIPAAGVGFQIIDPKGQKLEWWGADTWYTDGSGVMKLPCELEYGRGYQAVEVVAPSGYVLADKPFLFDVLPENAAQEDGLTVITLTAPNSPTQISVAKVDEQGTFVSGATLQLMDAAGNVAAEWVTENTPHTLYGLPIGAEYTLHEAAAPEGWLLADDVTFIVQDTAEVQTITMTDLPTELHLSKVDYQGNFVIGATLQLLDKDGHVVDKWVSGDTPHVIYHLPIGATYTLHETAAPEGWFVAEDMSVTVGSVVSDSAFSMEDEEIPILHTTATVNGEHIAKAAGTQTISDVVSYEHLIPGKEYTVTGKLMDKATGKVLVQDGKEITTSITFTPAEPDGTVTVEFTVDASLLSGKTTVVFESLSKEGKELAVHADIDDEGQTVHWPEIHTTATIDGKKNVVSGKTYVLKDVVGYTNLIPGKEYVITGTVMDKSTGKALEQGGQPVTATAIFTPTEPNGTVELEFTIDTALLGGKALVVFESIQMDGHEVAIHADLQDRGQTVDIEPAIGIITIKDKPVFDGGSVKTGDSGVTVAVLGLLLSAAGLTYLLRRKQHS